MENNNALEELNMENIMTNKDKYEVIIYDVGPLLCAGIMFTLNVMQYAKIGLVPDETIYLFLWPISIISLTVGLIMFSELLYRKSHPDVVLNFVRNTMMTLVMFYSLFIPLMTINRRPPIFILMVSGLLIGYSLIKNLLLYFKNNEDQ